jgi:hypothetical protein
VDFNEKHRHPGKISCGQIIRRATFFRTSFTNSKDRAAGFSSKFSVFFQQIMPLMFELRGIRNFGQETPRGCFSYSVVGNSQMNAILHVILATLFVPSGKLGCRTFLDVSQEFQEAL